MKNSWSFPRQPGFPWRISGSHSVPISSVIVPPRPHCGTSPSKARSGTLVAVHRSSGNPLEGPHHRAQNPWNSGAKIIQVDPQLLFLDPRFVWITKQCTEYWIHPCHIAIYYNILKLMLYQKSLTQNVSQMYTGHRSAKWGDGPRCNGRRPKTHHRCLRLVR